MIIHNNNNNKTVSQLYHILHHSRGTPRPKLLEPACTILVSIMPLSCSTHATEILYRAVTWYPTQSSSKQFSQSSSQPADSEIELKIKTFVFILKSRLSFVLKSFMVMPLVNIESLQLEFDSFYRDFNLGDQVNFVSITKFKLPSTTSNIGTQF